MTQPANNQTPIAPQPNVQQVADLRMEIVARLIAALIQQQNNPNSGNR